MSQKLTIVAIALLLIGCEGYDRVIFPTVSIDEPMPDVNAELKVTLIGSHNIESEDANSIIARGFVWSSVNTSPDPNDDNPDNFIMRMEGNSATFEATVIDPNFDYEEETYYVRSFVEVKDEKRDFRFVSEEVETFNFRENLQLIMGLTEQYRDSLTLGASILVSDSSILKRISEYGHIVSAEAATLIDDCTEPNCYSASKFNSGTDSLKDNRYRTDPIYAEYNTTRFIRAYLRLDDGSILYSEPIQGDISGKWFNPSTNYPKNNLNAGVAASSGDSVAYVGVGDALYEVREDVANLHQLIYKEVQVSWLDGQTIYERGASFIVQDQFCFVGGRKSSNQPNNDVYCLNIKDESSITFDLDDELDFWEPRNDLIAFTLGDTAYFGFGSNSDGDLIRDFFKYHPDSGFESILPSPPVGARSGQSVAVIGSSAYITSGRTEGATNIIKFSVDANGYNWEQLTPIPSVPDRINSVLLATDESILVGLGRTPQGAEIINDFWEYGPLTDNNPTWSRIANPFVGEPIEQAISFRLNGSSYFGCGENTLNLTESTMWKYTP